MFMPSFCLLPFLPTKCCFQILSKQCLLLYLPANNFPKICFPWSFLNLDYKISVYWFSNWNSNLMMVDGFISEIFSQTNYRIFSLLNITSSYAWESHSHDLLVTQVCTLGAECQNVSRSMREFVFWIYSKCSFPTQHQKAQQERGTREPTYRTNKQTRFIGIVRMA